MKNTSHFAVFAESSADTAFAQSALGRKLLSVLSDQRASAANKAVAEQLLRNPVRATAWGIEELASHADTSAATLSRFARSMGFSGFAALRDAMAQVLQDILQPMEKLRDAVQPGAKQGAVTQSLEAGLSNARSRQHKRWTKPCSRESVSACRLLARYT